MITIKIRLIGPTTHPERWGASALVFGGEFGPYREQRAEANHRCAIAKPRLSIPMAFDSFSKKLSQPNIPAETDSKPTATYPGA